MKESLWGYWIVILGISIMSVMILLQSYTTTSEQDYYLLKGVMQASMYEAVDYGYYRDKGELKMNAEKFVENFVRRFSETVNINKTYRVVFYDIYEMPPAASVGVYTESDQQAISSNGATPESVDVSNRLTGILYTNSNFKPTN